MLSRIIDDIRPPRQIPSLSLCKRFWHTLKYSFANSFFPITKNESFIRSLKNKHQGQRAFLIGNGPSLNDIDLNLLKNEITFGTNSIFLNHSGFYPKYYIVEDVLVAEDRASEINGYKLPTYKFFGNYLSYVLSKSENTLWLNVFFRYDEYADFPNFSENALRCVWTGGTVSYLGMQLAYYMGITELYMVGFDHNYDIPSDVKQEGNRLTSQSSDVNHFHPDYFGKGLRWHDPRVDRMEMAYERAKEYFEKSNKKIFNATAGGHLEVFERVDFNSIKF
jgi:hypothetical protein